MPTTIKSGLSEPSLRVELRVFLIIMLPTLAMVLVSLAISSWSEGQKLLSSLLAISSLGIMESWFYQLFHHMTPKQDFQKCK